MIKELYAGLQAEYFGKPNAEEKIRSALLLRLGRNDMLKRYFPHIETKERAAARTGMLA